MDVNKFKSSGTVNPVEMFPGVHRRTLATTEDMMLVEITFEKGAVVPNHHHANHQVGYVVSGEIELMIDGLARICQPGDSYAISGDVDHRAQALTECRVVDVFTPPREIIVKWLLEQQPAPHLIRLTTPFHARLDRK